MSAKMFKFSAAMKCFSLASVALLASSCGLKVTDTPLVEEMVPSGSSGGSSGSNQGSNNGGSQGSNTGGGQGSGNTGGSQGSGNTGGSQGGGNNGGGNGTGGNSTPGTGGSSTPGNNGGSTGNSDAGTPMGTGGSMTGPAPSGMTVDLGGTQVPKEKAIAFIHFGHSNMAGRGTAPANLRPWFFTDADPRAWMYHATGARMGFQPAKEPFTAGDSTSLSRISAGPGTAIVKQAAAMASPDYHFISVGFAQNALFCRNYAVGTTYFKAAIAGPLALKGKVTWGAIVIMLGITERHGTADDINNYPTCINNIVTEIRNQLGEPNLPLMITDYEMSATNESGEDLRPSSAFAKSLIPRIHTIPSFISKVHPIVTNPPTGPGAVKNSAVVPTEGLSLADDHHFQLDAQKKWAQDLLDIMKEAGWAPWATK